MGKGWNREHVKPAAMRAELKGANDYRPSTDPPGIQPWLHDRGNRDKNKMGTLAQEK